MGLDSTITIGDRIWSGVQKGGKDYIYCEMSYEGIMRELNSPNPNDTLKAHVWLTLSDGSIIDATGDAHFDMLSNRGDHPLQNCVLFTALHDFYGKDGDYHRPFLVGTDFLVKIGAMPSYLSV